MATAEMLSTCRPGRRMNPLKAIAAIPRHFMPPIVVRAVRSRSEDLLDLLEREWVALQVPSGNSEQDGDGGALVGLGLVAFEDGAGGAAERRHHGEHIGRHGLPAFVARAFAEAIARRTK